jgi:multiple antibiotic resistance protein
MAPMQRSLEKKRPDASFRSIWPFVVGLIPGGPEPMKPLSAGQIFIFFFLMLGPIKIIGPFAKLTRGADPRLAHRIAWRAILFASLALLVAALLGESFLERYNMPLPVLALAGGIVLFLVALQGILQQFTPPARSEGPAAPPTLNMAITPIAFPTIVTPYGIAALIVFIALSPGWQGKLVVGVLLLGIMLLNVAAMLLARHILHFLGVFLQILGAVLGIIQVALGLQIILNSLRRLWV